MSRKSGFVGLRGPVAYGNELLAYGFESGKGFSFKPISAWGSLNGYHKSDILKSGAGGTVVVIIVYVSR